MAAGNDGDDRKDAASSQPLMEETTVIKRELLTTTSIGTLTSPSPSTSHSLSSSSSVPPDDSVRAPSLITLPFDVMVEILCKLPVKLLMQLRCVCKSWNSLISDPKFAKKHLRWSQTLFTRHHLILCRRDLESVGEFLLWDSRLPSVFNSSVSTSIPETQLSYPLNTNTRDCYDMIIGSCDGILCFSTGKDYSSILVWNPSIRKFKILPPLEINQPGSPSHTIYGFGYDHLTDNYKMVAVCYYESDKYHRVCKTVVKVHTLGTNSWKRIQDFPSTLLGIPDNESGKFVSGTINWLVSTAPMSSWAIVSLDLGKESYQELLQPDYGGEAVWNLTLGVLRDCLCALSHINNFLDVWVMKDYGNKESWTKLFTVPYELLGFGSSVLATARYISEDDQVLMDFLDTVVVYNSRNGTLKIPEIQDIFSDWFNTDVYVESLISP